MPRCLMAKKWKAYPWPDRETDPESEEEIDVVGDTGAAGDGKSRGGWAPLATPQASWAPSSPTAGATAPSPPPEQSPQHYDNSSRITVLYNGKFFFIHRQYAFLEGEKSFSRKN